MKFIVQCEVCREFSVSSKKAEDIQPMLESEDTDTSDILDYCNIPNLSQVLTEATEVMTWLYNQVNHDKVSIPNKSKTDLHSLKHNLEEWNNVFNTTLQESI